jgi:signal transduction histidine kinase
MRKVAWVFVLAVFVPSLVLAWLAVRSLRDQQFLIERQQSLLYQGIADGVAKDVQNALTEYQHSFVSTTTEVLQHNGTQTAVTSFDELIRKAWPLAQVGFVISPSCAILAPSPNLRSEARTFLADNGRFLGSREAAEVYLNQKLAFNNSLANAQMNSSSLEDSKLNANNLKGQQARSVIPQQQSLPTQKGTAQGDTTAQYSKLAPAEAEFRQLIGQETEGTLARFVDNKLSLLFWYRPAGLSQMIFGVQIGLPQLESELAALVQHLDSTLRDEICLTLLDDAAKPLASSRADFHTNWKRPFVATEIGEVLPHWEVAVYLIDPGKLERSAGALKLTLGLIISVLVLAIGIGSWLIVTDLNRQLRLARQKTDFVSNVSHELKTPLTSIRMFAELLAEGRVTNEAKQRSYLDIITAEAARLTRLINNVLDFSRMERGEKEYHLSRCDMVSVARETAESFRPHLEANGFRLDTNLPQQPLWVNGDQDALAQVLVNLLSNAEKYSQCRKEIELRMSPPAAASTVVEIGVLDRGIGVPPGLEERIFEKFYRAHDSLSSGIHGSGLGLTLARQIAKAHNGDLKYQPREGGGSCFTLRLALMPQRDDEKPSEAG